MTNDKSRNAALSPPCVVLFTFDTRHLVECNQTNDFLHKKLRINTFYLHKRFVNWASFSAGLLLTGYDIGQFEELTVKFGAINVVAIGDSYCLLSTSY